MRIFLHGRQWRFCAALAKLLGVAAIVAGTLPGSVLAQAPGGQESVVQPGKATTGFKPDFNMVQEHPARPQGGRDGIDAMMSVHSTSGEVEVIVGQGRMLSLRQEIARDGRNRPLIAIGNPGVVDIDFVNSKMIRITARRAGRTDLTILTDKNETYVIKINAVYELASLRSRLAELFPDASIKIRQNIETVYVSGEVRDAMQMRQVIRAVTSHIDAEQSLIRGRQSGGQSGGGGQPAGGGGQPDGGQPDGGQPGGGADPFGGGAGGGDPNAPATPGTVDPGGGQQQRVSGTVNTVQIINLLRIPGSQQVMLKCRLAEVNRGALRQMGFTFGWSNSGSTFDTGNIIAGALGAGIPTPAGGVASPTGGGFIGASSTFGFLLDALRQNNMAKLLAEPELMTMSGHPASFLVGGEIPIPVPQQGGGGGSTITIEYRQFGTRLEFVPMVLDKELIRLTVTPEVSELDVANGVTIAADASPVPAFRTRRASTTVELREGQTLALAGLMQVQSVGARNGLPLAGDLPYLGNLFRRTVNERTEAELMIAVTPHLVEPMSSTQTPRMPGDDVNEPNDLELYLLGRIEGRTGRDNRSTTKWDDPLGYRRIFNLEKRKVSGVGFSE